MESCVEQHVSNNPLSFPPRVAQNGDAMLKSIFASPSKPKHSDEPMEDWYLEGLEVLENSKRVADLKKRMTQRATQQWGVYFELLMIAVLFGLGLWRVRLEAESVWSFIAYGLLIFTFITRIIERIENASIARLDAAMELTQSLTKERRNPQKKTASNEDEARKAETP
jgi:hypothetical protein